MILSGTGHRPPKLGIGYSYDSFLLLSSFLSPFVVAKKPTMVISGGALGFDQALASVALDNDIPYTMALPFHNMDSRWPEESRVIFRHLLDNASRIVYLTDGDYDSSGYVLRDRWMVDNSDAVLTIYDEREKKSGTGMTVRYAEKQSRPIENVWPQWVEYRERNRNE